MNPNPEYVKRLEAVARVALGMRPIGTPVSIAQIAKLERALDELVAYAAEEGQ